MSFNPFILFLWKNSNFDFSMSKAIYGSDPFFGGLEVWLESKSGVVEFQSSGMISL